MPQTQLEIVLEQGERSYSSGDYVTGSVKVTTSSKIKVKSLRLRAEGSCMVHIQNPGKGKRNESGHTMKGDLLYDEVFCLLGEDSPSNASTLPKGEHSFSFRYLIPEDAPSSVQLKNGFVYHNCKATLVPKMFNGPKIECSLFLDVIAKVDLNLHNYLLAQPVAVEKRKGEKAMLRNGEAISARLQLNRSGFVPEEDIIITAEVTNMAKCVIPKTTVSLIQTVTFRTDDQSVIAHNELSQKSKKHSEAESIKWNDESLSVPKVPPTTLQPRLLIDIQYYVKLEVKPKHSPFKLEVVIPVTIGSVAFASDVSSNASSGSAEKSQLKSSLSPEFKAERRAPTASPVKPIESPVSGAAAKASHASPTPTAPSIEDSSEVQTTQKLDKPPSYEAAAFSDKKLN